MRCVFSYKIAAYAVFITVLALFSLACGEEDTDNVTHEPRETAKKEKDSVSVLTQPANAAAGEPLSTSFQLVSHDGEAIKAAGVEIRVLLNKHTFATGSDESTLTTDEEGIAHFEFTIEQADDKYALVAAGVYKGQTTTSAATSSFDVTADEPAAEMSWITGTDGVTNDESGALITIELRDTYGNPVAGAIPLFGVAASPILGVSRDENIYNACSESDNAGVSTCVMTSIIAGLKPLVIAEPVEVEGDTIEFVWDCDETSMPFGGGNGDASNPLRLCAPEHLSAVGQDSNALTKHLVVVQDIDMNDVEEFYTIGDVDIPFTGHFDGTGKRIKDLLIRREAEDGVGFFGNIGEEGSVQNVFLENVDVRGGTGVGGLSGVVYGKVTNSYSTGRVEGVTAVGGLIGSSFNAEITSSHSTSRVLGLETNMGGLVGSNLGGRIVDSYATGRVEGAVYIGGLLGNNLAGRIITSYAIGRVGGESYVGGLVGTNSSGQISDSYATGIVTGTEYIGGLVGNSSGSTFFGFSVITTSYATGPVQGDTLVGGLVGEQFSGTVTGAYWDQETSQISSSRGGTGLNTMEFSDETAFTDAGWDFGDIWVMGTAPDGEMRPILQWQAD